MSAVLLSGWIHAEKESKKKIKIVIFWWDKFQNDKNKKKIVLLSLVYQLEIIYWWEPISSQYINVWSEAKSFDFSFIFDCGVGVYIIKWFKVKVKRIFLLILNMIKER